MLEKINYNLGYYRKRIEVKTITDYSKISLIDTFKVLLYQLKIIPKTFYLAFCYFRKIKHDVIQSQNVAIQGAIYFAKQSKMSVEIYIFSKLIDDYKIANI